MKTLPINKKEKRHKKKHKHKHKHKHKLKHKKTHKLEHETNANPSTNPNNDTTTQTKCNDVNQTPYENSKRRRKIDFVYPKHTLQNKQSNGSKLTHVYRSFQFTSKASLNDNDTSPNSNNEMIQSSSNATEKPRIIESLDEILYPSKFKKNTISSTLSLQKEQMSLSSSSSSSSPSPSSTTITTTLTSTSTLKSTSHTVLQKTESNKIQSDCDQTNNSINVSKPSKSEINESTNECTNESSNDKSMTLSSRSKQNNNDKNDISNSNDSATLSSINKPILSNQEHKSKRGNNQSIPSNSKEIKQTNATIQDDKKSKTLLSKNDYPSKPNKKDSNSNNKPKAIPSLTIQDAVRDTYGARPRANSTDGELNLPRRGLCDEGMVLASHKWNASFPNTNNTKSSFKCHPRGLINLGNTCFLNATLQCLAYLPTFYQCLETLDLSKRRKLSKTSNSSPKSNTYHSSSFYNKKNQSKQSNFGVLGQKLILHLKSLLLRLHGQDGNSFKGINSTAAVSPKEIVRLMSSMGNNGRFRLGRQEDAHEFLVHLLDAMKDGELKAAGINPQKSGWRSSLPIPRLDETTVVHRMFGGYLRSQIHCTSCNHRSNTYDPFLDLSLEVHAAKTLSAAVDQFTKWERLDQANRWKCGACKKYVCARKQLTIFRPSLSLIIHMKRFSFGSGLGGFQDFHYYPKKHRMMGGSKITKNIDFPSQLSLPLSDGRQCEYILTGVILHVGSSASSGHYTAYVKKPLTDKWLHLDDCHVSITNEKSVLRSKDAYVLLYCRKEVKLELPSPPPRQTVVSESKATRQNSENEQDDKKTERKLKTPLSSTPLPEEKSHEQETKFKLNSLKPFSVGNEDQPQSRQCPLSSMNNIGANIENKKPFRNDDTALSNSNTSNLPSPKPNSSHETPSQNGESTIADKNPLSPKITTSIQKEIPSSPNDQLNDEEKVCKASTNNESSVLDESDESYIPDEVDESDESSDSDEKSNSSENYDTDQNSTSSSSESSNEIASVAKKNSNKTSSKDIKSNDILNTKQSYRSSDNIILKNNNDKHSAQKKSVIRVNSVTGTKIEVALRSIKEESSRKDPWKKNRDMRISQNSALLGNLNIGKWDDDDNDDDINQQIKKTSDMRKALSNKIVQEERKRKRNMYLNTWDAALDAGKKKKVKEKKAEGQHNSSSDPKLNPFHRIQSSMQAMGRGRAKGHNNASSLSSSFRRKSLSQKRMKKTKIQRASRKH